MPKDIIEVLAHEHREVEQLLEQLQSGAGDRAQVFQTVKAMLEAHSHAEEDIVYPAIRQAAPDCGDMIKHGTQEHHEVEELLQRLATFSPADSQFDRLVTELTSNVQDHVQEEENIVLPAFEQATNASTRQQIAEDFLTRKALEIPAGQDGVYPEDMTKDELYERAKELNIEGRSSMTKDQLARAINQRS